jgi:adenylosuccinate synthase
VERLGELLGLPVDIISVGPDREQTIRCSEERIAH